MNKRLLLLLCLCGLTLLLLGCSAADNGMNGHYQAVNPPEASGETVIQELTFDGGSVTMISGDVRQTVQYTLDGDTFTIHTKYGEFSYAFEKKDDGGLVIDGVDYRRAD